MKLLPKAILLGFVSEAVCLGLLIGFSRIGPCGPSNLAGALFFPYMTPGLYVAECLHISDPWTWIPTIVVHTIIWSCVWFGLLRFVNCIKA